ncbi:MAG: pyridoxamine 5'-phosphate oxidase family protein [Prevotellaceae bacterium]|jgi:nitroimidazol reductase NimA-like FMN-containing flavoprotein (pyridoxamine 5'-phosphate oxidase superfamily)|nr:pyridoxamine 5'-phosphate oxidase family protein [Prevotellaceae bacterium]
MYYEMRKKDRQISDDESYTIVDDASFGIMATVDCDGIPYAVPLNFVRDGDILYFHGALKGHKIDNLKERHDVCVTFVKNVFFPENHFTTIFESVILFGKAEEVIDDTEKIHGLKLLCKRFIPKNMESFGAEIDKHFKATSVWKIKIETISGKQRKFP